MKCQKCARPATVHITDIEKGKPHEFHFCDEHALIHLSPPEDAPAAAPSMGEFAKKLIGATSPATEGTPQGAACPNCSTTFEDFRKNWRLGCPFDYEVFREELMPLLEKIHNETRHAGKCPKRAPRSGEQQATLIQLRNELKRAIAAEDYEAAARLRDRIRDIEREQGR